MLSPSDRVLGAGDPFTTAFGIWGALTCRAGFLVADAGELPEGIRDYVERLVAPYFERGRGVVRDAARGPARWRPPGVIDERLGDPFFGIFLNPGHLLHLDEWVASPVSAGSTTELRSGMALQVDIIPATGTAWFTTNIEDGLALADEALREELAELDPGAWASHPGTARVHARGPGHRPPRRTCCRSRTSRPGCRPSSWTRRAP